MRGARSAFRVRNLYQGLWLFGLEFSVPNVIPSEARNLGVLSLFAEYGASGVKRRCEHLDPSLRSG
jgi:hypothetical protein